MKNLEVTITFNNNSIHTVYFASWEEIAIYLIRNKFQSHEIALLTVANTD